MRDRILTPADPSITEQLNFLIPEARLKRITAFVASDQFIPIMRYVAEGRRDIIDAYGAFVLNLGREFPLDATFQKTISPFQDVLRQASIDEIRNPTLCISVSTGKKRQDWGLAHLPDVYMGLNFHVLKVYEESKKKAPVRDLLEKGRVKDALFFPCDVYPVFPYEAYIHERHTVESSDGSNIEHSIRSNMLYPLPGNALRDYLRMLPSGMLTRVEEGLAELSRRGIDEIRSISSRALPA